jgi:transcriptional regulator with XRE-family HTH domain
MDILSFMSVVSRLRRIAGLTQAQLADAAGTSQPTVAAYESGGKVPNLRTLERLASSVGLDLHVSFVPAMTREDRRSLALHSRIAQQLQKAPEMVLSQARANLEHMWRLHPGSRPLLDEWADILAGPLEAVVSTLTDPGLRSRELRQVTPFAGVLDRLERSDVYRRFRREEARR